MNKNKILLLTLVHPDFLPPVYAMAQVLRDLEFDIHILTFDSFVPAKLDLGPNIELEFVGSHYAASTSKRIALRNKFTIRAMQLAAGNTTAVISYCPFSFHCGLKLKKKKKLPLIYIALEISDFRLSVFLKSPLSNFRNLRALQNIRKADLIATPSIQRSAWLAGRCHLEFMPHTILNTAYVQENPDDSFQTFKEIVPAHFLDKKIILYTGAVNADTCITELVRAFELVNDLQSVLIINGIKDDEYGNEVRTLIDRCKSTNRIMLLPYLTRDKVLALQANANIGVTLTRDHETSVKSRMMAPNKVGEYMAKDLYILGIMNDYLRPIGMMGVASLSDTERPTDISRAMRNALVAIEEKSYKARITIFVKDFFCMQKQLIPVINFLNNVKK